MVSLLKPINILAMFRRENYFKQVVLFYSTFDVRALSQKQRKYAL